MRVCLWVFAAVVLACAAEGPTPTVVHGKLVAQADRSPSVETADHKLVLLSDEDTTKILHDVRLNGFEVEAHGHFDVPDRFVIDPIHTRALMVRKDGKLKLITYYCELCNIRANIPGPCACCQRETILELIDPGRK